MELGISAAPSIAQDLYERYSGQILGYCVNQLGSREEAEDALQSTFLNAHRALQRGVTPDAELPWLFKIAHNVCLTRRRSTRRRGRIESPSDFEAVQDVVAAPPRDARDELLELTDALADLPCNQRRAILLREWQGLSYREIANELELSQSAVETLIFRARRTLAANLESKRGLLARAKQALDVGALLAAAKTLFEGAVAAKATAAAVVVSSAVVVATGPSEHTQPAAVDKRGANVARASVKPAAVAPPSWVAPEPHAIVARQKLQKPKRAEPVLVTPTPTPAGESPAGDALAPPVVGAAPASPAPAHAPAPHAPAPVAEPHAPAPAPTDDTHRPAPADPATSLRTDLPELSPDGETLGDDDGPPPKPEQLQPIVQPAPPAPPCPPKTYVAPKPKDEPVPPPLLPSE